MNRLFAYIRESKAELAKVTWPRPRQAAKLTIAVVIFSAVFAAFISMVDYGFSQVVQKVILKS